MKSKTSYFNKTIFKKNLTMFWPIWGMYLMYKLMFQVGGFFLRYKSLFEGTYKSDELQYLKYSYIEGVLSPSFNIIAIFLMACVIAMGLYNYLFIAKAANMFHSLPLTRKELFITNYLSGILFMWIPQILAFICSVLVFMGFGLTMVNYLGQWLLIEMGVALLAYSIAVLCAMLTGQLFALPVYYGIANFLALGLKVIFAMMVSAFSFGIDFSDAILSSNDLEWLSPLFFLVRRIGFDSKYGEQDAFISYYLYGGKYVAYYLIMAVICVAVAYFFYQKRDIEKAGDLLTINYLKPVFRWGAGFCFGCVAAMILKYIFDDNNICFDFKVFLIMVVFLGVIGFFVAQMFIEKSFKVMHIKLVKECMCFFVFVLISVMGMYGVIDHISKKLPDQSDIVRAYINLNYPVEYTGEEISEVYDFNRSIIEKRKLVSSNRKDGDNYVNITYVDKSGDITKRYYYLNVNDISREMIKPVVEKEKKSENILTEMFCYDFENMITPINGGDLTYFDKDMDEYRVELEFTREMEEKILAATIKDVEEGCFDSFYSYYDDPDNYGQEDENDEYFSYTLELMFSINDVKKYQSIENRMNDELYYYFMDDERESVKEGKDNGRNTISYTIPFHQGCHNIINTLKDLGYDLKAK